MSRTENTPARWAQRPDSPEGRLERARDVAALPATDAVARDRAGETPHAEVRLLKDSGLVTLLGLRTRSLHDPIACKRVEVGRYALLGEIPEPTWCT